MIPATKIHPNIKDAIHYFITNFTPDDVNVALDFYGFLCTQFTYYEDTEENGIGTAGVSFSKANGLQFYYNPDFIKNLDPGTMKFIMLHECEHVLYNHLRRCSFRMLSIWNIATDAIINSDLNQHFKNMDVVVIDASQWVLLHSEYDGKKVSEYVYDWLLLRSKKLRDAYIKLVKQNTGIELEDGFIYDDQKTLNILINNDVEFINEIDMFGVTLQDVYTEANMTTPPYISDKNCDKYLIYRNYIMDNHMVGEGDDGLVDDSSSYFESYLKDIISKYKAEKSSRGLSTGHLDKYFSKYFERKPDHIRSVKKVLSEHAFGSKKVATWKRPNYYVSGLKGYVKHKIDITVLLDVSGSMSDEFNRVLNFIYQNDLIINLVQCDTEVQKHTILKSRPDFYKIQIKGLGGTILQPGIDYITSNKKIKRNNLVILTDGETDHLNFSQFKGQVVILSTKKKCSVCEYYKGQVKQIVFK